jgi:GTP-binding protein HflX
MSAKNKDNVEELRRTLYDMVKAMHIKRYPYNNLLY